MEEYKISSSLEWTLVRDRLLKSKRNLTMFSSDIYKLLSAIDEEVKTLGNLEVTARNQKSNSSYKRAQDQVDLINLRIKNFNKLYMMALLTHE